MIRIFRLFPAVSFGLLSLPIAAFAQTNEDTSASHKLSDLLWGVCPFIVLGILFWFFFIRMIRKQQSPAVKRHQEYMTRHEQHMERMEQLHERIAKALEKERP